MTAAKHERDAEQDHPTPLAEPIIQRDDGLYQLGWHDDAAGPFESRQFAEAVARAHR
ncbi:glutamine cyclotransferase [Bradyrhizobium sp. LB14.3]|uniref:hypothetical protein n=1 Tax=Bradyrhizobium sp. LB14.3 TaxID=3156328 RepID=UPI0033945B18